MAAAVLILLIERHGWVVRVRDGEHELAVRSGQNGTVLRNTSGSERMTGAEEDLGVGVERNLATWLNMSAIGHGPNIDSVFRRVRLEGRLIARLTSGHQAGIHRTELHCDRHIELAKNAMLWVSEQYEHPERSCRRIARWVGTGIQRARRVIAEAKRPGEGACSVV